MNPNRQELMRIYGEHVFGKIGFPICVVTRKRHKDYPLHSHDFAEIVIISKGTGTMEINNQPFHLKTGDTFVIHKGLSHLYRDTQDLHVINILFDPDKINLDQFDIANLPGFQTLFVTKKQLPIERSEFSHHFTLTVDQMIQIKALTDIMEIELAKKNGAHQMMVYGHFILLTTYLSRYFSERSPPDSRRALQIGKAIQYLEKHYSEPVDIIKLSEVANMSRRSLFRGFNEVTQHTPLEYLMRIRIQKSIEIFETTDKSVTEVAYECGFQDSNYFSRQFKKIVNFQPSEFKRRFNRNR